MAAKVRLFFQKNHKLVCQREKKRYLCAAVQAQMAESVDNGCRPTGFQPFLFYD